MEEQKDNWFETELNDALKQYDKFSKQKKKHYDRINRSVFSEKVECK